jgi:hypothetical protein
LVLKTKDEALANLTASIAYIPARYESGVKKADWATPAGSEQAETNYASGVGEAVSKKSRQAGVRKISNADWQKAAVDKGKGIIGERIRGALGKWSANWGPMYDSVASAVSSLPPKTTDYRANINSRLVPTVEAWKRAARKL